MRTKCFTNFKFLVEIVELGIYGVCDARVLLENLTIESKTSALQPVITHKLHFTLLALSAYFSTCCRFDAPGSSAIWKYHVLLQTK